MCAYQNYSNLLVSQSSPYIHYVYMCTGFEAWETDAGSIVAERSKQAVDKLSDGAFVGRQIEAARA